MEYLIVFQILCGAFGGYVASRKGRNVIVWLFIAGVLPLAGLALVLMVGEVGSSAPNITGVGTQKRRRPRRCDGSFIPDCRGCPHFSRPLFDPSYGASHRGRCRYYRRELREQSEPADRPGAIK